jgi:leader peptidase (prepilin peptidase)/N-methyltransferase
VEGITGLLFALFYIAVFMFHQGPFWATIDQDGELLSPVRMIDLATDWPMFGLYLFGVAALLAASLIDAELYLIPAQIPLLMAGVGVLVHTLIDRAGVPGALTDSPGRLALAAGGSIGLLLSIVLLRMNLLPLSFAEGVSSLEVDKIKKKSGKGEEEEELREYTPAQVRGETLKEVLFLLPPIVLGCLAVVVQMEGSPLHEWWGRVAGVDWVGGLLGSLLGGLVGGGFIWIIRVVAGFVWGREAMGLGDADLMFGVGTIIGFGAAIAAVPLAACLAVPLHLILLLFKSRHELPFGPYLGMASCLVMLFYFPIYNYYGPGIVGVGHLLWSMM